MEVTRKDDAEPLLRMRFERVPPSLRHHKHSEAPGCSGQKVTFFEETGKCLKIAENASEWPQKCLIRLVASGIALTGETHLGVFGS